MSQPAWTVSDRISMPMTVPADPTSTKPPVKQPPDTWRPSMAGLRTDEEFDNFMSENKRSVVCVEFGTSWCLKCHEIFPKYYELSKKYNGIKYAIAQIDYMKRSAQDLKYSPTFAIYNNGKKVDEIVGKEPVKLEDHLWLHSDTN